MAKRWMKLKEDYKVFQHEVTKIVPTQRNEKGGWDSVIVKEKLDPPKLLLEIPKGTVGFIVENDRIGEKGYFYCLYTVSPMPEDVLEPADLPTVEHALDIIESHYGHHTRKYSQFQFNIKVYDGWDFPKKAIKLADNDEELWEHRCRILEDAYLCFVKKDYCDSSLESDFDWIEDSWQAGRMGGWLVLKASGIPEYGYRDKWEELKAELDNAQTMLENGTDEVEYYERVKAECEDELHDLEARIIDLAMDLSLIDAKVKKCIEGTIEYLGTEEAWSEFIARKEEEYADALDDTVSLFDIVPKIDRMGARDWRFRKDDKGRLVAELVGTDLRFVFERPHQFAEWVETNWQND